MPDNPQLCLLITGNRKKIAASRINHMHKQGTISLWTKPNKTFPIFNSAELSEEAPSQTRIDGSRFFCIH